MNPSAASFLTISCLALALVITGCGGDSVDTKAQAVSKPATPTLADQNSALLIALEPCGAAATAWGRASEKGDSESDSGGHILGGDFAQRMIRLSEQAEAACRKAATTAANRITNDGLSSEDRAARTALLEYARSCGAYFGAMASYYQHALAPTALSEMSEAELQLQRAQETSGTASEASSLERVVWDGCGATTDEG